MASIRSHNFFITDIPGGEEWVLSPEDLEAFWRQEHETRGWAYSAGCIELAPSTGTAHAHVIAWTGEVSVRLSTMKGRYQKLRGINRSCKAIQIWKGGDDAKDYIFRKGKHANKEGAQFSTWELGTPQAQGARTDKTNFAEVVHDNEDLTFADTLMHSNFAARNPHAAEKVYSYLRTSRRNVAVTMVKYHPDTLDERAEAAGDDFGYFEGNLDGYRGEKVLYFYLEDPSKALKWRNYFKYTKTVSTRHGVMAAEWTSVAIAT